MRMKTFKSIDEYIASYPKEIQPLLKELRTVIKKVSPAFEEAIRYGIPTFRLYKKNIVHFGAYESHIGFYPGPAAIVTFAKELKSYKQGKGTVQFPLGQPLPLDLIKKIVQHRVLQVEMDR